MHAVSAMYAYKHNYVYTIMFKLQKYRIKRKNVINLHGT